MACSSTNSDFRIITVILENGGRRPMLINRENGMPLVNPAYYITSEVFRTGKETNTQQQVLNAIQFTYVWAKRNCMDIESRFKQGLFLNSVEVKKFCDDIMMDFRYYNSDIDFRPKRAKKRMRRHRIRVLKPIKSLNKDETTNIKLTYAKNYLDWLARETIYRTSKRNSEYQIMEAARKEMIDGIDARIPSVSDKPLRQGLEPEARARLLEVIDLPPFIGPRFG